MSTNKFSLRLLSIAEQDFLDIIEEGNLGLMHAIDKFDPKKGFRFSTYGAYWIEQSIRRAIDEQSKTIRIPPHAWEALRRWLPGKVR